MKIFILEKKDKRFKDRWMIKSLFYNYKVALNTLSRQEGIHRITVHEVQTR